MYTYESPLAKGYQQFYLSTSQHNQCFPKMTKKWQNAYEYYYSSYDIQVDCFVSPLAVILETLCLPLNLLMNGLSNYKEILDTIYGLYHQKSKGQFHGYNISNPEERQKILGIAGSEL